MNKFLDIYDTVNWNSGIQSNAKQNPKEAEKEKQDLKNNKLWPQKEFEDGMDSLIHYFIKLLKSINVLQIKLKRWWIMIIKQLQW